MLGSVYEMPQPAASIYWEILIDLPALPKIGGLLLKVRIYSDLHLEIEAPSGFPAGYAGDDADLVILAGDIHTKGRGVTWAQEKFGVPVAYVCGRGIGR